MTSSQPQTQQIDPDSGSDSGNSPTSSLFARAYGPPSPSAGSNSDSDSDPEADFARDWVNTKNQTWPQPNQTGYDWVPFYIGLIRANAEIKSPQAQSGSGASAGSASPGGTSASKGPKVRGHVLPPVKGKRPPKRPGDGDFTHIEYIPGWTHPDFDPNTRVTDGTRRKIPERDVLVRLRPALLQEDVGKNPTDYAKRWGINPDRPDRRVGRSRLSPTWSLSRNIMGFVNAQLQGITDEGVLEQLRQATRDARAKGMVSREGGDISLEVFEMWKKETNFATAEDILGGDGTHSFEDVAERVLNDRERRVYKQMIEQILDDQDYQRFFFEDMTTDELVATRTHTMSNSEQPQLRGKLHALVRRDKWESTLYRGGEEDLPRYLYNIGNRREEWDVHRNSRLWEALQPALQLVSKILYSKPAFWQATKDLRTRQPIPDAEDPRHNPQIGLTKIVPLDKIDEDKCYPAIKRLNQLGFNTTTYIDRLLRDHLELSIGSGRDEPDLGDTEHLTYGWQQLREAGPDTKIEVHIAAELLWPLLEPSYSSSEKLTASFVIAVTLLHELMHATEAAVDLLTGHEPGLITSTLPTDVKQHLWEFRRRTYNRAVNNAENYYEGQPYAEMGWAFEWDFFGQGLQVLTVSGSKYVSTQPLAAAGIRPPIKLSRHLKLLGWELPLESWLRPISIDHIHRFFTQDFWDDEFVKYGHDAFKHAPPDKAQLALFRPEHWDSDEMSNHFGRRDWSFFSLMMNELKFWGYSILSYYLYFAIGDLREESLFQYRWTEEMRAWYIFDDPLNETIQQMEDRYDEGMRLTRWLTAINQQAAWREAIYTPALTDYPANMSFVTWQQQIQNRWGELHKEGGILMRLVASLRERFHDLLRCASRMVYEFLSLEYNARRQMETQLKSNKKGDPLQKLLDRLRYYRDWTSHFRRVTYTLSHNAVFQHSRAPWLKWYQRFEGMVDTFDNLLRILKDEKTWDDNAKQGELRTLNMVPSTMTKKRAQRLRKLALKEYSRMDYRIQNALDEFNDRLQRFNAPDIFPNAWVAGPTLDQATKGFGQMNTGVAKDDQMDIDDGKGKKKNMFMSLHQRPSSPGLSDVEMHDAVSKARGYRAGPTASAPTSAPKIQKPRHVFGQSSSWNGTQKPATLLGAKDPPRSGAVSTFQKYMQAREGSPFSEVTNKMPIKFQNSFAEGLSAGANAQLAGGIIAPVSQIGTPRSTPGLSPSPFPHPFADATTLTKDLDNIVKPQLPMTPASDVGSYRESVEPEDEAEEDQIE